MKTLSVWAGDMHKFSIEWLYKLASLAVVDVILPFVCSHPCTNLLVRVVYLGLDRWGIPKVYLYGGPGVQYVRLTPCSKLDSQVWSLILRSIRSSFHSSVHGSFRSPITILKLDSQTCSSVCSSFYTGNSICRSICRSFVARLVAQLHHMPSCRSRSRPASFARGRLRAAQTSNTWPTSTILQAATILQPCRQVLGRVSFHLVWEVRKGGSFWYILWPTTSLEWPCMQTQS